MSISLAIIVPTRDRIDLLSACLNSIFREATDLGAELVVVNNDSVEPATFEYFQTLKTQGVSVLDFPGKFNYAKMMNFVISKVSADYVLLLNNDARCISQNSISHLIRDAELHPDSAVVGCAQVGPNGTVNHLGIRSNFFGYASQLTDLLEDCNDGDCCKRVDAVTFAVALIRKSVYLKVGGMDAKFPSGYNDVDYCLRVNRKFSTYICRDVTFIHEVSATRGSVFTLQNFMTASFAILLNFLRHGHVFSLVNKNRR